MSVCPDTPPPGCWPCRRRHKEKITLPPIAGASGSGKKDAKPAFIPRPPQTQYTEKVLKKLEKQKSRPSRKLKKAGIEVAADAIHAKPSSLGWGLVGKGSSTLSLPVLERPESRFSSAGRISRMESESDRDALAEKIRQKQLNAELARQRALKKNLEKNQEMLERCPLTKERKYTNTLKNAHLAPTEVQKQARGGYSYKLEESRPITPAARPSTARLPAGGGPIILRTLNVEEERARLREKQEHADRCRQRKIEKKVKKARESSLNGEQSRERRQKQDQQKRQKVKKTVTERLTSADTRRESLIKDRQHEAHQEIERARRIVERKREMDILHNQVQMDMALRHPENVDALASRAEILEVVYSDFWDQ